MMILRWMTRLIEEDDMDDPPPPGDRLWKFWKLWKFRSYIQR
jgi:hypothetical protein